MDTYTLNALAAQRLLGLVERMYEDAVRVAQRDIDTLTALGFRIQSEQVGDEQRTFWIETEPSGDRPFRESEKALLQEQAALNARALAMLQGMAAQEPPTTTFAARAKGKKAKEKQAMDAASDKYDLFGATLQVKDGNGATVFQVERFQRIFFNGKDGSEIKIGVDQDGNLRLWVDAQLVLLPVSTNSAKVIELHDRIRTVQA